MPKAFDTPSEVGAEAGKVIMDGPDAVAVTMTPRAAFETSERLRKAAAEALGQDPAEEEADSADQ